MELLALAATIEAQAAYGYDVSESFNGKTTGSIATLGHSLFGKPSWDYEFLPQT